MTYHQRMDAVRLGWLLAYLLCPPLWVVMAYLGLGGGRA